MLVVLGVLAAITAVLVWGTERIDRPRRRAMRQAAIIDIQPAE